MRPPALGTGSLSFPRGRFFAVCEDCSAFACLRRRFARTLLYPAVTLTLIRLPVAPHHQVHVRQKVHLTTPEHIDFLMGASAAMGSGLLLTCAPSKRFFQCFNELVCTPTPYSQTSMD